MADIITMLLQPTCVLPAPPHTGLASVSHTRRLHSWNPALKYGDEPPVLRRAGMLVVSLHIKKKKKNLSCRRFGGSWHVFVSGLLGELCSWPSGDDVR